MKIRKWSWNSDKIAIQSCGIRIIRQSKFCWNTLFGFIWNICTRFFWCVFRDVFFFLEDSITIIDFVKTTKYPGPDRFHSRVFREFAPAITKLFLLIFSATLDRAKLPLVWKKPNVSPIFKKGTKQHATNYRPVNLACIDCKLQESMIPDDIIAHMHTIDLISKKQIRTLNRRQTPPCYRSMDRYFLFGGYTDACSRFHPGRCKESK